MFSRTAAKTLDGDTDQVIRWKSDVDLAQDASRSMPLLPIIGEQRIVQRRDREVIECLEQPPRIAGIAIDLIRFQISNEQLNHPIKLLVREFPPFSALTKFTPDCVWGVLAQVMFRQ